MRIPISAPALGEEEINAVTQVLRSGWLVQGPRVAEFEALFSRFTGIPYAVATTSCTTALHLAMVALGIGPGDEVIVPSFTWVATANAVEMQGARAVFVDIDLSTFNLNVGAVERSITPRTKAIVPVSLFGLSAPLKEIVDLASRRRIHVVEDAACALGAQYQGAHAGALADISCFSFHPRKLVTTGEGGMLATASPWLAESLTSLRNHGASKSDYQRHGEQRAYLLPDFDKVGYNYRMTDLQAALGVVQMSKVNDMLGRRRSLAARYDAALAHIGLLTPPAVPLGFLHSYQSYVCLFGPSGSSLDDLESLHVLRNEFMDKLEARGISTRPGTHAVHMLSYYARKYAIQGPDFPNALCADHLSLALPLYTSMTDAEQDFVIESIEECLAGCA